MSELTRIFAEDYVQYDESGKASTKQDVIVNLASGKTRLVSMTRIRLLREDVVIVHGSEEDCPRAIGPALLCVLRLFGRGGEA